jgi:hypothetical protein
MLVFSVIRSRNRFIALPTKNSCLYVLSPSVPGAATSGIPFAFEKPRAPGKKVDNPWMTTKTSLSLCQKGAVFKAASRF